MPETASLRVVVLTHDFAPDTIGIAPYITEVCKDLAASGHNVDVVTMPPHYPSWKVPPTFRRGYSVERQGNLTIRRIPTYVPESPTLLRRLAFEISWFVCSLPVLVRVLLRRPDVVIAAHPGLFASVLASLVAVATRSPLVIMVQDLVAAAALQSGIQGGHSVAGPLRLAESRALRRATRISIPTETFRPPLSALGIDLDRVCLVRNWSRVGPYPIDVGTPGTQGVFHLVHTGNLGRKQGLDELIPKLELALADNPELRITFSGGGSDIDLLDELASTNARVSLVGTLDEEAFVDLLRSADAFLLNERSTLRDMCLPSKLTTYFAAGRPILAVTHAASASAEQISDSGAGIRIDPDDVDGLSNAIRTLRADPSASAQLGEAGSNYAEKALARDRWLPEFRRLVAEAIDARKR